MEKFSFILLIGMEVPFFSSEKSKDIIDVLNKRSRIIKQPDRACCLTGESTEDI